MLTTKVPNFNASSILSHIRRIGADVLCSAWFAECGRCRRVSSAWTALESVPHTKRIGPKCRVCTPLDRVGRGSRPRNLHCSRPGRPHHCGSPRAHYGYLCPICDRLPEAHTVSVIQRKHPRTQCVRCSHTVGERRPIRSPAHRKAGCGLLRSTGPQVNVSKTPRAFRQSVTCSRWRRPKGRPVGSSPGAARGRRAGRPRPQGFLPRDARHAQGVRGRRQAVPRGHPTMHRNRDRRRPAGVPQRRHPR
jgi:hypothetical protein